MLFRKVPSATWNMFQKEHSDKGQESIKQMF
jgi:hypothetical protein